MLNSIIILVSFAVRSWVLSLSEKLRTIVDSDTLLNQQRRPTLDRGHVVGLHSGTLSNHTKNEMSFAVNKRGEYH